MWKPNFSAMASTDNEVVSSSSRPRPKRLLTRRSTTVIPVAFLKWRAEIPGFASDPMIMGKGDVRKKPKTKPIN